jgi:geranylgeranyl pyrophosphate synthase
MAGAKGLDHKDVGAMVNRLAWMVRRVSEGQQLDIEFEDRMAVSEEDYFEMIEGKTAVMFLTCAEVGSRMAGAKGLDHKDVGAMVNRLAWMVRRVSEGQQLDIEFEDRMAVSEEDYFEMIEGKTAVMFLTCAEVGSRMAGADEETIQCMADWGLAVGLCFQLMDDLIDVLSDSDTLGKPAGSDLAQGKRTLMVIHALSQSDSSELDNLKAVLGKGEDATQEQIDLGLLALNKIGSVDYAKKKAEMYHSKAHSCLDRLPDSPAIFAYSTEPILFRASKPKSICSWVASSPLPNTAFRLSNSLESL